MNTIIYLLFVAYSFLTLYSRRLLAESDPSSMLDDEKLINTLAQSRVTSLVRLSLCFIYTMIVGIIMIVMIFMLITYFISLWPY